MAKAGYHHGDLRRALIDASADLLAERGPAGFSLREVARRASVSPGAPSHHFGDTRGLLTAVAAEGFARLNASFEAIDPNVSAFDRLQAHTACYVELGMRSPGSMAIMFRSDLVDTTDESYASQAPRSYETFESVVRAALDDTSSGVDVTCATKTLWATCHGLVQLYRSEAESLDDDVELAHLVDHATAIVYLGMREVPTRDRLDEALRTNAGT